MVKLKLHENPMVKCVKCNINFTSKAMVKFNDSLQALGKLGPSCWKTPGDVDLFRGDIGRFFSGHESRANDFSRCKRLVMVGWKSRQVAGFFWLMVGSGNRFFLVAC